VLGMACDAIMLVHGYVIGRTQPADFGLRIEKICEHIDHICQLAGNARHVGIGTDLDGGFGTEQCPTDLDSIADIATLADLLAARGYSQADVDGILHANFVNVARTALK
jgi:membrane dipeptidase